MMTLRQALVRGLEDLRDLSVPHALIGGLAVGARTEPRNTRDVDVAVGVVDDAAAEAVIHALAQRGYTIASVIEQAANQRLATVRMRPPGTSEAGLVFDLLFASSGIEPELVSASDSIVLLRGVTAPVAKVGHLIPLKLLARSDKRPQDAIDLFALKTVATDQDWTLAREAVRLITQRGYARGRDLEAALDALMAGHPAP